MSSTKLGKSTERKLSEKIARTALHRTASMMERRASGSSKSVRALKKAGKLEGMIKGVATSGPSGPERKKWDVQVGSTNVSSTTPYITSLFNSLAQGTGYFNRVGDKIRAKACDFILNISAQNTTSISYTDVLIVWDKQPNITIAAAADAVSSILFDAAGVLPSLKISE